MKASKAPPGLEEMPRRSAGSFWPAPDGGWSVMVQGLGRDVTEAVDEFS
ncbi:MAG TPA: hypothetical protein VKF14_21525 [Candidatus Dormibacteraeota bacterium]|nr:hypothetical protein [Candidatus Dormibacteraeota bacterium]